MPTQEILVRASPKLHDPLVADLADLGFDAFVTEGDAVRAFRQEPKGPNAQPGKLAIADVLSAYGVDEPPVYTVHEDRNWNAEWESTIRAVRVGTFVVAPDWDLKPESPDTLLLRINPKMSFGTGHHESTRLALRLIERVLRAGDRVLDAGTGTGILAIAAAKLGASNIVAFDTDPVVADNFRENTNLNNVAGQIDFVVGSIDRIEREPVDVIVANINRNVLLDYTPEFSHRLKVHGRLVLSGLLIPDRAVIVEAAVSHGFQISDELTEGDWWSGAFVRVGEEHA